MRIKKTPQKEETRKKITTQNGGSFQFVVDGQGLT